MLREEDEHVVEGLLHCSNSACQREYPVIDGVPVLVRDIRRAITDGQAAFLYRDDLAPEIEGVLGDCLGPGASLDLLRQHVSAYCAGHWSDLDPQDGAPAPVLPLVDAGIDLIGGVGSGPALDLGCAVGRASFALAARAEGLVLGMDLHFGLLRVAARVLRTGRVRYGRRRVGLVYDRRDFAVDLPGAERVDFWMADALALPFASATFGTVAALNVLDCVQSPYTLLGGIGDVLQPGGRAFLCTPYDWSPAATPVEAWLGGHSQRGPERGAAEPALRAMLTPGEPRYGGGGLRVVGEREHDWVVRLHERAEMRYRVDMVGVERG